MDFSDPEKLAAGPSSSNAIQSVAAMFADGAASGAEGVEAIGLSVALGGGGPVLVGDGKQIADELAAWAEESDLDGFNFTYVVMPETFEDIVEHVVPELQRRGLVKRDYADGTYRDKLFGHGPRLDASHPAAAYRNGG
jgi:alkanesulfonate monooxygenase